MLGTIYRYHQHPPLKDQSKAVKYKKVTKEDSDAEMATSFLPQEQDGSSSSHRSMRASERHSSWGYALKVCLLTGLSVIARSRMWDHFTKRYHELLEVPRSDITSRKQMEILNYPSTWLFMWLWRFHCADQFLTFTIIAMFFDRLWEWIVFSVKAALPNLVVFGVMCQLHVMYVESNLAFN